MKFDEDLEKMGEICVNAKLLYQVLDVARRQNNELYRLGKNNETFFDIKDKIITINRVFSLDSNAVDALGGTIPQNNHCIGCRFEESLNKCLAYSVIPEPCRACKNMAISHYTKKDEV